MTRPAESLTCPVCKARFRGTVVCSRCGGDLAPLMRIAARAWRLRCRAVAALQKGDVDAALEAIAQAGTLHDTALTRKTALLIRAVAAHADGTGSSGGRKRIS